MCSLTLQYRPRFTVRTPGFYTISASVQHRVVKVFKFMGPPFWEVSEIQNPKPVKG